MCVLIFYTALVWNIPRYKKNSEKYYYKCTYIGLHVKYLLFPSDYNETLSLSTDFGKMLKLNFTKTRPVRAKLFYVEGRTDGRTSRSL
jgi:hypothetical protein